MLSICGRFGFHHRSKRMPDSLAAVVLAAGAGTRLRPLTRLRPKALCPVGDRPLVDHALDRVGARAERRGGYRAAADAYERAAELTADPLATAGRQLAAARGVRAGKKVGEIRRARVTVGVGERAIGEPLPEIAPRAKAREPG